LSEAVEDPHVGRAIDALEKARNSHVGNDDHWIERAGQQHRQFSLVRRDPESGEMKSETCSIKVLEGPEDPEFEPVYQMLLKGFGPEELDPEDVMKDQMGGKRKGLDSMGTRAQLADIRNGKGEVVCVLNGGLLPILDEKGHETGESVFMIFYIHTRPDHERLGLSRELMITAHQMAEKEARARGLKLIGVTGECTWDSRRFWESMGLRRAYAGTGGRELREVPYIQPPLDFDLETGAVAEGCDNAPEHFMVQYFDDAAMLKPDAQKLQRIVRAFYRANNYVGRAAFKEGAEGDEAYEAHRRAITPHEEQFSRDVSRGNIRLLSGPECRAFEASGGTVVDWVTCDEEKEVLEKERTGQKLPPPREKF
jgi:GNAT superfamily N-acetyltransferase